MDESISTQGPRIMTVNLNKIYTKTGDKGYTRLVGGKKIFKGDDRLDCYGTVDELNSCIGMVRTLAEETQSQNNEIFAESSKCFAKIQNELFDIGSVLATPLDSARVGKKQLEEFQIEFLENKMDAFNEELQPLTSFTLPGGSHLNAQAHMARTVCRRLERLLWKQNQLEPIPELILKYINRLSDFLFVYSRWVILKQSQKEFLWEPGKK